MVRCPECGAENQTPARVWRVLDEPSPLGVFNERGVGIFQCVRCSATFPQVVGKRRLVIVDADEISRLKIEIEKLQSENLKLREDMDITSLQAIITALEQEVAALRKEKKELEIKLSQDSGSLDQVP